MGSIHASRLLQEAVLAALAIRALVCLAQSLHCDSRYRKAFLIIEFAEKCFGVRDADS